MKLNTLDQINNELISYAYNRAEEIRNNADKIRDSIINNQPSSIEQNKPLNIHTYIELIEDLTKQLNKLQALSVQVYRYNHGLEKEL